MNTPIEPPPRRGSGCLGKGCLIFIVLAILLAVIGAGGTFWSVRNVYLSGKPAPIPQRAAASEPSPITPGETPAPAPVQRSAEVRERLDTMKKAARAHEPTDMELTAADINALIAANRKSRGTASVGIDGNVLQANFAIPLNTLDVPFRNAFGLADRYLNASVISTRPCKKNITSHCSSS